MISEEIADVLNRIYEAGLTTASGGNISVRDEGDVIRITPGSTDKGNLSDQDVVVVDPDGNHNGKLRPSSELPMHQAIYRQRPDLRALLHAHSPALVAFSLAHEIPDTRVWYPAWKSCGPVGYAPYALPGSQRLGAIMAGEFAQGFSAVILENHGIMVGGRDLAEAYDRFLVLEFCARAILNAKEIGNPVAISESLFKMAIKSRPDPPPVPGEALIMAEESERADEIIRFLERSLKHGLMTDSHGMISVRHRPGHFLITPPSGQRRKLTASDLRRAAVDPSEETTGRDYLTGIHQSIYRENPEIQSIMTTHTPWLMAHAITEQKPDPATLPESWLFLQHLHLLTFSEATSNPSLIPISFRNATTLIIANDSVTVTGNSLFQAFDRLELAEFTAQSMALTRSFGRCCRLTEQQLDELNKTYLHEK